MLEEKILDPTGKIFDNVIQRILVARDQREAASTKAHKEREHFQHIVDTYDNHVTKTPNELVRQVVHVNSGVEKLKLAILDAAKEEDIRALDQIRHSAAELAEQSKQLDGQLKRVYELLLQFDEHYVSLETAVAKARNADKQYADAISAIRKLCADNMKPWTEIISSLEDGGAKVSKFFLDEARKSYSSDY